MILAVLTLVAALTAGQAPKAEVTNVRFGASKLLVTKASSGMTRYVRGPLRVDMSFKRPVVRRPLLRIACLCDVNGELTCYSGLWDQLNTNRRMSRSDIAKAFKQAGVELASKERESAFADPKRISLLLNEVTRDAYRQPSYGETSVNGGLFRVTGAARVLLYRFELWQNGVLVGSEESSRAGLVMYDIPPDWYEWKKHPQKFKYVSAP